MPNGTPYSREQWDLIHYHSAQGKDVEAIFDSVFKSDHTKASPGYIRKLAAQFKSDWGFAELYTSGPFDPPTRSDQRVLTSQMCYDLIERREENNQMTTRALTNAFNAGYFPNTNDYVLTAAVQRFFDSIDISRKTNERRHIRQNPIEAYRYLCQIESLDYTKAKDTDEASMKPKQFWEALWLRAQRRC